LRVYFIYHLNLCFSSIEESERKKVINRCYWPLLKIIDKYNVKIGIEATAYTLEVISKLDKKFIEKLKYLIKKKKCEFIGSGYSQIIGPLVPYKLNFFNLKIANNIYKKILDFSPKTALINEQVFAQGILDAYYECNYRNIIIDWDNAFKANNNISAKSLFSSQQIFNLNKKKINLIWSSSILFQKYQRYIHSEISLDEYMNFIYKKVNKNKNFTLCLYCSDLEVMNYRPKRFKTEPNLEKNEWKKFELLIQKLRDDKFKIIIPSETIKLKNPKFKVNLPYLNNATYPSITKKQSKYNITRWSCTGRNDLYINTTCWRIYNSLIKKQIKNYSHWKDLCYLWSSDFRTHITTKRWNKYIIKLKKIEKKFSIKKKPLLSFQSKGKNNNNILIIRDSDKIKIKGKNIELVLDIKKGCSIEKFIDQRLSKNFIFGQVPHGYYDDILYGADFYSGHVVIEPFGTHKITDLKKTNIKIDKKDNFIFITSQLKIEKGNILKIIIFDNLENKVGIYYKINIDQDLIGTIRLNYITLNPNSFKKNLFYETNCGGKNKEKFLVGKNNFDHGSPVSHLVSSNQGLGVTENEIMIGDNKKNIKIEIDRNFDNQTGFISYKKLNNKNLFRLFFSVKEHDDTSKDQRKIKNETLIWISSNLDK